MRRSLLLRLFFTIWLVYLFHFNPDCPGSGRYVYLTMSLVEHGTIKMDAYRTQCGDVVLYNGHYYMNTNPGLSFIAAPVWWAFNAVYKNLPRESVARHNSIKFLLAHFVLFALTTALFGALSALLLALFVYKRIQVTWRAILAALLYSFGSIAFFHSTCMQQNIVIAFMALLIFIILFEPKVLFAQQRKLQLILVGFIMGSAVFIDLSIIPFLVVMVIPILQRSRRVTDLMSLSLSAFLPILALLFYQYIVFGNPFLPPQAYLGQLHAIGFLGITFPSLHRLLEYLVTPKSGLFLYMPYSILGMWYMLKFWNEKKILLKTEKIVITFIFLSYLLYSISATSSQISRFGPRYMLPAIPFICLVFTLYLYRRALHLTILLIGLGFVINIAGAQIGIGVENLNFVMALYATKGPWLPILYWIQSHLAEITGYTPGIITPYGLFLLMIFCLTLIWLPYFPCLFRLRKNNIK